jgi:type I restriction enzyme S subunit
MQNKILIPFSKLYEKAGEGGTPDTKKSEYYENGQIPFVKIDDLNNKYLENNQWFISEEGLKKSSAWIVPSNSILYSNGETIGAISINKYPVATKQGILGIVIKDKVLVEYMFYFMSSKYFRREICKITTHGTMKTAYIKDIDSIKCYLPEYKTQMNIVKILNVLTSKIEIEQLLIKKLKQQKQYLLQQMFI